MKNNEVAMRLPTKADLRSTFNDLANQSVNGVPGVMRYCVGCPSQKVVFAAMTHGDEPSGLGAFRFLIDNARLLRDVDLILAIHNIDGGARWFDAANRTQQHECRAYGWNFNRLPLDFPEAPGGPPALQRVRDLWERVYDDTTFALDMHSADQPLCPDGVTLDIAGEETELERLSDAVPAAVRLRGITKLQMIEGSRTKPIGSVFGGRRGTPVAMEVENDSHESPVGILIAVRTAVTFLAELGCIYVDEIIETPSEQSVYDVLAAVMVPGTGYTFVSEGLLKSFAPIEVGDRLLSGPMGDVRATHTGCLIFAPAEPSLQPGDELEETCFELSPRHCHHRTIRMPKWLAELE